MIFRGLFFSHNTEVGQKNHLWTDTNEFLMPKTGLLDQYSDTYDEWFDKNRELYDGEMEVIRRLIPPGGKRVDRFNKASRF